MNTIKSITAESIRCFVALYIFISICLEIDTVPHILLTSLLRVDLQITLTGHPIMRPPLGLYSILIPAQEGVVVLAAVPLDWRLVWNSEKVICKPFL